MKHPDLIILVHGLWMSGFELAPLRHRLESEHWYKALPFSYPTVSGLMVDHIKALRELAQAQGAERLHFVGHSLGGLVVLRLLEATNDLPPGRAVLLGSPLRGSLAAQGIARWPIGRAILGHAIRDEVLTAGFDPNAPARESVAARVWDGRRDVGIIAGSGGIGLGRLFAHFAGENDGTVQVEETRLEGAKDHIVLPVTHTGMLFSGDVTAQVVAFLRNGHFARP